jgi:tRNA(fMet)-specific endonuclease VapC
MRGPYLLDTSTASYIIKGNRPALDCRLIKIPVSDLFISSVTEAELRYGVARHPQGARFAALVEEFLLTVTILPWDSNAARQYGQLRADLERKGLRMENLDLMIASHALAQGIALVTNDKALQRIPALTAVDWTTEKN